jgi:8-oxo-dGTP diphosphatase
MSAPRVGVGILITRGTELLLIRRHGSHGAGTWSPPGGHLDYGESPEQCAVREALEETGVEVADVRFRAVTNDFFESERRHYVTIWMEGAYRAGVAVANLEEMSEVRWFSWKHLPTPLFLPLENLLAGRCYPAPPSTSSRES